MGGTPSLDGYETFAAMLFRAAQNGNIAVERNEAAGMDESLERQLSQEGRLDSHGVFTLSLEQAQLKWSRYALHESVESSLFLVRCFVALGCRRLSYHHRLA